MDFVPEESAVNTETIEVRQDMMWQGMQQCQQQWQAAVESA
jgi:hypothetical protein